MKSAWFSFAIAALMLVAAGCSEDDNNYPAPVPGEPATISVMVTPDLVDFTVLAEDSASVQVTAVVRDASQIPIPGVTAEFGAQRGWIESTAMTDQSGAAQVTWWIHESDVPDTSVHEMSIEAVAAVSPLWDADLLTVRR